MLRRRASGVEILARHAVESEAGLVRGDAAVAAVRL